MKRIAGAAVLTFVLVVVVHAGGIGKWRTPEGTLYLGSDPPPGSRHLGETEWAGPSKPEPSSDGDERNRFSVDVSLERRRIEKAIRAGASHLAQIRDDIRFTEEAELRVGVGQLANEDDARRTVADAIVATSQFERDRFQALNELRSEERAELEHIRALRAEFAALRARVREEYGELPPWWRDPLRCPACPSDQEIETALGPPVNP